MYNTHTKNTCAIWSSVSLLWSQLTSFQQTDGGRGDLQDVLLAGQVGHTQGACGCGEAAVVQLVDLLARLKNLQRGRRAVNCPRWADKSCMAVRWWVSWLTSPDGMVGHKKKCCVCVCVCIGVGMCMYINLIVKLIVHSPVGKLV